MDTAGSGAALRHRSNVLIGEHIHTLMWRSGKTQSQLAALLGVDQGSVSRRLRGKREWSGYEIAVTAAWLGVASSELMPEIEITPDDDGGDDDGGAAGAPTRARTWDLRITRPLVAA